ncbi:O-fucosyltransferase family protein [Striga asiatica]|uniref:O-fucosyltransferase family protein n=1 Tax=Striga asiatica TaxID=4170 RepID=A0A5A7PQL0_STRAF|nr:O-fucosyltransferase family protein [Striga asiatica]
MDSSRGGSSKCRKRPTFLHNYRTPILLAAVLIFGALFISSRTLVAPSHPFPIFRDSGQPNPSPCSKTLGDRFLWYAPHSGFSNQLAELKNAVVMAAILNRTLVVPPVLDHHAVALGSCPKFRVSDPNDLRFRVWNHSIQLIRDRRQHITVMESSFVGESLFNFGFDYCEFEFCTAYKAPYISMADIVDLSSLVSNSGVKFIDFRAFVSIWCGVNVNLACNADSSSSMHFSLLENLKQCGSLLSGYDGNVATCLFASQEDCRTTVWTYQKEDGILDSFQADDELRKKRKISYSRKRKDVYKALGSGTAAGSATVLALGSLFTAPYKGSQSHIDIREAPSNQRVQSLIQKIEFLPFVSEILSAGKRYAVQTIKAPFVCAQLRLLDGQFKNHWKSTFVGMKQKLDSLRKEGPLPVHVFVMTDLPRVNWTGSYLGDLAKDHDVFKLFVLRVEDELVVQTAKKLLNSGSYDGGDGERLCNAFSLPDMLLYLEETICSCASLGFIGTSGSTIAESIEIMRKNRICS